MCLRGWAAWAECRSLFVVEESGSGDLCTALYYEGCPDEISVEQALELLEDGTITENTLVYSDQAAFEFEGWTTWGECRFACRSLPNAQRVTKRTRALAAVLVLEPALCGRSYLFVGGGSGDGDGEQSPPTVHAHGSFATHPPANRARLPCRWAVL